MSPKDAIALLERRTYQYLTASQRREMVALIRRLEQDNSVYRKVVISAAEKSEVPS